MLSFSPLLIMIDMIDWRVFFIVINGIFEYFRTFYRYLLFVYFDENRKFD